MNTIRKNVLIAVAAFGLAGTALAQSSAPNAPASPQVSAGRHAHAADREQFAARRAERQARHAAKLRADLKLTSQQEAAFAAFLAAGKPAGGGQAHGADERAAMAALPAPQRLERMIERQKDRTARMEARLAALNTLYATFTPEQKKVFDSQAMRGFGGRHHGGRHHGGEDSQRGAAVQS